MKFACTATLLLSTAFGFVAADADKDQNLRGLKGKDKQKAAVVSPLIYGGTTASEGDYPYFASFSGCGGALIAPDIALTAAHCGDYTGSQILIGAYKYQSATNGAEYRTCVEYEAHPNYITSSGLINDWAICKLDSPIDIPMDEVKLVLNDNSSGSFTTGEQLKAMGFGRLGTSFFDYRVPEFLKETTLEGRTCASGIPEQICAGGENGQNGVTDVCQGDSGGPLVKVVEQTDGPDIHYHVGLVSSGALCPQALTGTYARTSAGLLWIQETACLMGTISEDIDCSSISRAPTSAPTEFDCLTDEVLTVTVETDRYASENNWILEELDDSDQGWIEIGSNDLPSGNTVYENKLCLADDGVYRWTLFDSFGDGLCFQGTCGEYMVDLNGNEILSDGAFTNEVGVSFVTGSCTDTAGDLQIRNPQGNNIFTVSCGDIAAYLTGKPSKGALACEQPVVGSNAIVSDLCRSLCSDYGAGPC